MYKKVKNIARLGLLSMLVGATSAYAGGFQLFEANVSNLGNAYAGVGAEANDASTVFFNPAGMTRIKNSQFMVAGTWVQLNIDTNINSATTNSILNGSTTPISRLSVNGNPNQSPGGNNFVPAMHFVYPFNDKLAWGFGVAVPFGLKTYYAGDSMSRFMATLSSIQVFNLGPAIAYQFNRYLSVGVGFDLQYFKTELDQAVLIATPATSGTLNVVEGVFKNKGDDFGYGWHAGVLLQPTASTRFGLTYHSQVKHNVSGTTSLEASPVLISIPILGTQASNAASSGNFESQISLPDYVNLSAYHDINDHWAVLAGLDYTHWSVMKNVNLSFAGPIASEISTISAPLNFRDTYRLSIGANYRLNKQWLFRIGTAYDQSPVPDNEARTFRLPDADRYWLALGAQYKLNKALTFDVGYSHLFVKDANINNNQFQFNATTPGAPLFLKTINVVSAATGSIDGSVNELGLQVTWNIDHD